MKVTAMGTEWVVQPRKHYVAPRAAEAGERAAKLDILRWVRENRGA